MNSISQKILVAGDLFPGGKTESYFLNSRLDELFGDVIGLAKQHDFCIAGLESTLTKNGLPIIKSGPTLKADPKCAKGIQYAGFHALSLANNHILDFGGDGLKETLSACKQAGLLTVGAGLNLTDAAKPLMFDLKGIKIAVIAVAENEFSIAEQNTPGANPLDTVTNYQQICQAKAEADFILMLIHGGNEYYPLPSPRFVKTCRFFADIGVHAIICSHIHVSGGFEIYNNTPIVYSTGNFLFDWDSRKNPEWYEGYLVSMDVQIQRVISLQLIPYWQCKDEMGIHIMDEIDAKVFLQKISKLNKIISSDDLIKEKWQQFINRKKVDSLINLFGLGWIERHFLRFGVWPFWKMRKRNLPAFLNSIRCESHHEVLLDTLLNELNKQEQKKSF